MSPATAAYLEGLTAIHDASFFNGIADRLGFPTREETRGHELNVGKKLQTVHPVIRTNRKFLEKSLDSLELELTSMVAVTGWKSVFVNKAFTKRIVELTKDESDVILGYLFNVCSPILLRSFLHLPFLAPSYLPSTKQLTISLVSSSEP